MTPLGNSYKPAGHVTVNLNQVSSEWLHYISLGRSMSLLISAVYWDVDATHHTVFHFLSRYNTVVYAECV